MKCLGLFINSEKRICRKMIEKGMNGEVSDFDVEHYCCNNPLNCYYYRVSEKQAKRQPQGTSNGDEAPTLTATLMNP
jgi:hypothetical protein